MAEVAFKSATAAPSQTRPVRRRRVGCIRSMPLLGKREVWKGRDLRPAGTTTWMRRDILLVGPDRLACSSDGRAGRKAEVRCQAVVAAVHGRPVGATFRNAAIGKSRSGFSVSMPHRIVWRSGQQSDGPTQIGVDFGPCGKFGLRPRRNDQRGSHRGDNVAIKSPT